MTKRKRFRETRGCSAFVSVRDSRMHCRPLPRALDRSRATGCCWTSMWQDQAQLSKSQHRQCSEATRDAASAPWQHCRPTCVADLGRLPAHRAVGFWPSCPQVRFRHAVEAALRGYKAPSQHRLAVGTGDLQTIASGARPRSPIRRIQNAGAAARRKNGVPGVIPKTCRRRSCLTEPRGISAALAERQANGGLMAQPENGYTADRLCTPGRANWTQPAGIASRFARSAPKLRPAAGRERHPCPSPGCADRRPGPGRERCFASAHPAGC